MKYIVFRVLLMVGLVLMLIALPVKAQPTPASAYNLMCLPKEVGGTGQGLALRSNSAGLTRWHYCNDGFTWRLVFEAYPWGALGSPAGWALFESVKTSLPAAQAAASANLTGNINSEPLLSVWGPWQTEMQANRPPSVWVIARNGTSITRPVYRIREDGTRDPVSVGTTPVVVNSTLVPCDMRTRFLEWPLYYGRVPDSVPARVTVCMKR
jgi:hypothetical protein